MKKIKDLKKKKNDLIKNEDKEIKELKNKVDNNKR